MDSEVYQDQREFEEIGDSRAFQVRPEHLAGPGHRDMQELQAKLDHRDLLVKLESRERVEEPAPWDNQVLTE